LAAQYQGDYVASCALQTESLKIRKVLGDKYGMAVSLEGIAWLAAGQEQPERAVRLWAAAEVLREAIGSPLPSNQREEYNRNLAVVREALGAEAFAALWGEGRQMTLEEAVAYALQEEENARS
jgi:non-specific serine/threonine protein kinase